MDRETRYELLESLGAGSFATVYRARDRELGREVAVKQIHQQFLSDPAQLHRYWQEAQLLASLHHPNIVTIFDVDRERGWLILELMQGNLAERLAGRQMDLKSLKTTLAHALRALKYLHSRGVVHGDVKPSNMMLDHRKRVKLGDFGLARRVSDDEGSLLKGTTKYMAPEVVSDEFGAVGPASDLYSLGFTAYELMCGSENFEQLFPGLSAFGRNKQVAWMMWHAAPDRRLPEIPRVLEGVPADLARVVQKLVEKDQSKRYRSADEALSDLEVDQKIIRVAPSPEGDADGPSDPQEAARKKRLLLTGGMFAASLLLCAAMLFLPGEGTGPTLSAAPTVRNVAVIREIDPREQRLEIETLEEGKPRDLALDHFDVYLTNIRKYVQLDELQPGDRIEWEQATADGRPILKIRATRPTVNQGRVRHIDRAARRMVVAVEGDVPQPLELRLPERAEIRINDQVRTLDEVRVGDRVEVRHLSEAGDKPGRIVDRLSVFQPVEKFGFVTEVDPQRKTLTVKIGQGNLDEELTLPVPSNCPIRLAGETLALGKLQPGDAVRFEYDVEFRRIEASRPETMQGPVQSLDVDRRELVLNTESGPQTVQVGASCEIQFDGSLPAEMRPTLGDLRRSDQVTATFLPTESGPSEATMLIVRRPAISDRWALLIGVERTAETRLPVIPHARADVELVRETLQTRYAVAEDRIITLLDRPHGEMLAQLATLLPKIGANAELIVYVIGHGFIGQDGGVYLAGPEFDAQRPAETGLPLNLLIQAVNSTPSRQTLLLFDLSHAKSEQQPATQVLVNALPPPQQSTYIVASCREGERGRDYRPDRVGLFAHAIALAYSGRADADRDLHITPQELMDALTGIMPGDAQQPVLFAPRE